MEKKGGSKEGGRTRMRTPRRKEKRGGGKREDGYRCGQRQRIKLRLWMGAGRGPGVFVRARMIRMIRCNNHLKPRFRKA